MGTAQDALNVYRSWLAQGIHEQPPGSNRTPIGEEFGWNGVAWCAIAASVALRRSGTAGLWSASCYELIARLRLQGRWHGANRPQVGALAFYSSSDFPNGGAHVTIVESVSGGRMICIGGNESDTVKRSSRSVASAFGFGMPAYSVSPTPPPTPVPPPPAPPKGFLMALSDKQQADLYNAIMATGTGVAAQTAEVAKHVLPRTKNLEDWMNPDEPDARLRLMIREEVKAALAENP